MYFKEMSESPRKGAMLLHPHDYRTMKWKNGKGSTAEIAIFPPEAQFSEDPFFWRLSSARVTEGGPFSDFPGYHRYLTLLKGEGLKLHFGAEEQEVVLKKGISCEFSG